MYIFCFCLNTFLVSFVYSCIISAVVVVVVLLNMKYELLYFLFALLIFFSYICNLCKGVKLIDLYAHEHKLEFWRWAMVLHWASFIMPCLRQNWSKWTDCVFASFLYFNSRSYCVYELYMHWLCNAMTREFSRPRRTILEVRTSRLFCFTCTNNNR